MHVRSASRVRAGLGHGGAKRFHRHRAKLGDANIRKPSIRRLARRGGVKRMSSTVYDRMRLLMTLFMVGYPATTPPPAILA